MTAARAVSSLQNERVKAIRALDMRKARKETGLFVAEGVSVIASARDSGAALVTLVHQAGTADAGMARDLVAWALAGRAEVLEVTPAVLAKLAHKDNPQTMLATFRQRWAAPPEPVAVHKDATWLALEAIRDPGNLGTIIRTADAVGAAGIILAGICCDPFQRECVRATMGSIFAVPLVRLEPAAFLALAKAWPGDVIGTHLAATDDFRRATYRGPHLIVMGGEGPGLSAEATRACTRRVKIPMAGRLDSLNLAVATALMLYQVRAAQLRV